MKHCSTYICSITEGNNPMLFTYATSNQRVKTEYYDNDIQKTKYFASNYEQEIIDENIRELHYVAGPMGLAAIYVRNNSTDSMYYTHTDHLGSITEITDNTGTLLQRMQYDAWGKRSFITNNIGINNFLFDRGYTGHEHLDQFSLINMNGRLYDPILGRMLSPDNYVQNATSTQGFNRYSYAVNNPLVYTDPDGEFLIIDDFILGFFKGLISGRNPLKEGWNQAANSAKIYAGLFAWDESYSGKGDVWRDIWQVASRLTWEGPQTGMGFLFAQASNTLGNIESVDYYGGSTVLQSRYDNLFYGLGGPAMTMGSYIIGSNEISADANNWLFQHEYGHYLQSQASGPAYIIRYAAPSLFSAKPYVYSPVEQDANIRAIQYFHKRNGSSLDWQFGSNPIGRPGKNWAMSDYDSPQFQSILKALTIKPKFLDYVFPFESSIYNIFYYNSNPYVPGGENYYYGHR